MKSRFEDHHRELRKRAGGAPYADEAAALAAEEAEDRLRDFYGRTGLLVDDLVAAMRKLDATIVFPATTDPSRARPLGEPYRPMAEARDQVRALLVKLDEEASRA